MGTHVKCHAMLSRYVLPVKKCAETHVSIQNVVGNVVKCVLLVFMNVNGNVFTKDDVV